MTLGYLLDTNVVSEPLCPTPNKLVLSQLRQHQSQLAISSLVWHELLFGCYRLPISAKRRAIETYLKDVLLVSIPILPYDEQAAEWHASERARLIAIGRTPAFADGQIAAVAKVNGLTLVTFNVADFSHFADLPVQDWRN